MASPNLTSNLVSGNRAAADASSANIGIRPIGNAGGSNMGKPSPIIMTPPSTIPTSANPAQNPPVLPPGTTGTSSLIPTNAPIVNAGQSTAAPVPTDPNLNAGVNQGDLSKQLSDLYGKGVGSLLGSELSNLGSADSSYMKAYESAVAMPNSEALTTLQTSLANEGISGNSSTAALAQSDLLSQQTAQEGLQEQQLLQSNIAEQLGLTSSLTGTANQAQQNTGWSIFGSVLGDIGGAAAKSIGL